MTTNIGRKGFLQLATATLAAPFVASGAAHAAGRPVTLRVSTPDAITHPNSVMLKRFGDLLAERTEKAVTLQIFPDGQLGTMANAIQGVQMGTIDMAVTGPMMFETAIPRMGVFSLPFLFSSEAVAESVIDGPLGQALIGQTPTTGAYILSTASWGWRETETSAHAIRKPSDFRGLKLRLAPGLIGDMTFKTLGAIPTTIDASELYVALSQGTVDGFEVPFLSLVASKWYEVVKYVSLTNHGFNPVWTAISKRRLDSLPAAQQKIVRDTARELQPAWRQSVITGSEADRKFIEGKGIQVVDTDYPAFRAATRPVYDWFKKRTDAAFVDAWIKATAA